MMQLFAFCLFIFLLFSTALSMALVDQIFIQIPDPQMATRKGFLAALALATGNSNPTFTAKAIKQTSNVLPCLEVCSPPFILFFTSVLAWFSLCFLFLCSIFGFLFSMFDFSMFD